MIEIKPIQPHQIAAVEQLILTVCAEIFQLSEETVRHCDSLADIQAAQSHYLDNKGTFLVLVDAGKVVGSGAIRRLDPDICELKRMWCLKAYRGQGWGMKLSQQLLAFAQQAGCKKVRLDLVDPQKQAMALRLYERLGFYPIAQYTDGPGTVFMEKLL